MVAHEQRTLTAGRAPRVESERRFLSGDGAVLWAHSISTIVNDAQGQPNHVMVLLEDLAEVTEGAGSW